LEELFEDVGRRFPGREVDRQWRMDLLDAFSYMRSVDPRGFPAKEAILNGLLGRYPLSDDGYVAAAATLFWDNWTSLSNLFLRISHFLDKIRVPDRDPAILTHWAGVRFLLDSQRAREHDRRTSKVFTHVQWSDFHLRQREGWHVLEYHPGSGDGREDLETIQAGMLELVLPVLPLLNDDWRSDRAHGFSRHSGHARRTPGAEQDKRTMPTRSTSKWRSSNAARWRICSSSHRRAANPNNFCHTPRRSLEVTADECHTSTSGQSPLREGGPIACATSAGAVWG
jgi:hypothetical protein